MKKLSLAVLAAAGLVLVTTNGCSSPPADEGTATTSAFGTEQGSGLQVGLVTGRIYDDLAVNLGSSMRDFSSLGVKILRMEIEGNDYGKYRRFVEAAKRYDIEVLALVSQAAVAGATGGDGNPQAGDMSSFVASYVPTYIGIIDRLMSEIPDLKYVEVWNEPDTNFNGFHPFQDGNVERYAQLVTQVYETIDGRRRAGQRTPTIVAFDFSRHDDDRVANAVFNSTPITNHRHGYRPGRLRDGLPADIVSIHGYGNYGQLPSDGRYTYQSDTFDDAVNRFLGRTFADGGSVINGTPVWYTEVGYDIPKIGGEDRQRTGMSQVFAALKGHREITAAFWYDYRDDGAGGSERCGLRGNDAPTYTKHASYDAFRQVSGAPGNPVPTFTDVPFGYWAHDEIEAMFARGITVGYGRFGTPESAYGPEDKLTKEQLRVFIGRTRGENPSPPGLPSDDALRKDMAVALSQALGARAYEANPRGIFSDVPPNHPQAHEIEGIANIGVAKGYEINGHREFGPDDQLTRAQMAAFLTRAYDLH